jgi:hypothetical protein
MDQWPWGISATLDGPLAGGDDEEDRVDHLVRLVRLARISAPRPITPDDISEFVTLKVPGVAAALTLPETSPGPPLDTSIAGHFTTAIRGADGTAPTGDVVDQAQATLDAALVSTAVAHVVTGDYTTVNVAATLYAWPGYDKAVLKAEAEAAIATYLSPATWGNPPMLGDVGGTGQPSWAQETDVYRAEIVAQLDRIRGADRASIDSVAINGVTADLALTGLFPLPLPGTINVTVMDR